MFLASEALPTKPHEAYALRYSGGDNNLDVIMGAYEAPSAAQCRGSFSPSASCEELLEDMPSSHGVEIFGPLQNPSATVLLPQAVESGKPLEPSPVAFLPDGLSVRRHTLFAPNIHRLHRGFGHSFLVRDLGSYDCDLVGLCQAQAGRYHERHRRVS